MKPALPIANLDLLVKLMMMTTSPNDGEALVALRKATAAMDRCGITWDSLLRGKVTVIADPFSAVPAPRRASPSWTPPPRSASPSPPPPPTPRKPTKSNPASIHQL